MSLILGDTVLKCQLCKRDVVLPFRCNYCGQLFCDDHRLPEQHLCPNLPKRGWKQKPTKYVAQRKYKKRSQYKRTKPIKSNRSLLYLLLVACIAISVIYFLQNEDFMNTVNEVYNEISNATSNILKTTQDVTEPQKYFESLDELIMFLDNDNVSDIPWTEDFVCADFAETLIKRARKQGYNTLSTKSMDGDELQRYSDVIVTISHSVETPEGTTTWYYTGLELSGAGHAVCETTIGNATIVIEPQTDMIFELKDADFIVLYKGEITKHSGG